MDHLVKEILSHLSDVELLEMALKNKVPSEIEKLLRPYNNILKLKCNFCDNIVRTNQANICDMCKRKTCESCTGYQYKDEFNDQNILCNKCVHDDECMSSDEVIRFYCR